MAILKGPTVEPVMLAMLGAYHCGWDHAERDTRVGNVFMGALPAADALGMTEQRAKEDPDWQSYRSMFVSGYIDFLKPYDLFTDIDSGKVTRLELKAGATR